MKRIHILFLLFFFFPFLLFGQKDMYFTSGGELLFQFSQTEENGEPLNDIMRFTLFFHVGNYFNYDFSQKAGLFTGLFIRNIGYIHKEGADKIKRRSYTLGLPLAVKLGNMNRSFMFAGGEYEWLFHYKEKHFVNDEKTIRKEWFSNKTRHFVPSVFAGVQFPKGLNIKVIYYLRNFMNVNYRDANGDYPYANHDVRIIAVSLSMNLLRLNVFNASPDKKKVEIYTMH